MARPLTLTQPKQLLVEGRDAEAFFHPFVESIELRDIQIHDYGSITELAGFLKQFVLNSQFRKIPVTSLGIVRDAETSADSALQSVQSALQKVELPISGIASRTAGHILQVNVFILPGRQQAGMLETLLLRAVENEAEFACVDEYITCIKHSTGITPLPLDKARFLAYLASKPDIKPLTGFAARAGYLNFQSPVYDPLKAFLRAI